MILSVSPSLTHTGKTVDTDISIYVGYIFI